MYQTILKFYTTSAQFLFVLIVLTVLVRGGGGGSTDSSHWVPDQTEEGPGACWPRKDSVWVLPQKLLRGGPWACQDDARRSVNHHHHLWTPSNVNDLPTLSRCFLMTNPAHTLSDVIGCIINIPTWPIQLCNMTLLIQTGVRFFSNISCFLTL